MSTIDAAEIAKFTKMADEWWSATGKFKPLHKFNPCRISYIKSFLIDNFGLDGAALQPLKDLKILDIGCGGGLLCEPLANLGADVKGIDAGKENIEVAKIHAQKTGLKIDYQQQDVEELAKKDEKFDVVLTMEIVEHVADVEKFLIAAQNCLKPNGLMFVATLNRTAKSFVNAIVGAEYILRWLPKGTHDWKKFLKPGEIAQILQKNDLELLDLTGFSYSLLKDEWRRGKNVDINYAMIFKKVSP
jgi:2-polyprenyl-6-hydroxyphenyl methylase / 3-demethylubiquinone-9 3-methyltransferase